MIVILVHPKHDRLAAVRFFRKLLKRTQRHPRVIIIDKLHSYGAAKRVVLPRVVHRQSRYLNNRAENSHQSTREREWQNEALQITRACAAAFSRCKASWRRTFDRSGIC